MFPRPGIFRWLPFVILAAGCLYGTALAAQGLVEMSPAVNEFFREVIGDSKVAKTWIFPDAHGKDVPAVLWAEYQLTTPEGKRWEVRVSAPLDSDAQAQAKFRYVSAIPQIGPTERKYGDGYQMEVWYIEKFGHGHMLLRRGTALADVGGDLPLDTIKRKAAALERLLRAGELPRRVAEAARADEADSSTPRQPPPAPTPG